MACKEMTDQCKRCPHYRMCLILRNTEKILDKLDELDTKTINELLNTISTSILTLNEKIEGLNTDLEKCCKSINGNINRFEEKFEKYAETSTKKLNKINKKINKIIDYEETDIDDWQSGVAYGVNDLAKYEDIDYICIQSHVSQDDWTPNITPALWNVYKIDIKAAENSLISTQANEMAVNTCFSDTDEELVTYEEKTGLFGR